MKVEDLMKAPYYVDHDIKLKEAARIMSAKGIGSLIYMPKNKVEGLLTEGDLLKNFDGDTRLTNIMSKNVITVDKNDDIGEALRIMKENGIKRLPVMEKDKLVGIITLTDIAANSDELGEEFFFD